MKHTGGLKHQVSQLLRCRDVQMMHIWQVSGDTSTFRLIRHFALMCTMHRQAGQFEWRKASLTEALSMQKSKYFVACLGEHSERGLPLGNVRNDVAVSRQGRG